MSLVFVGHCCTSGQSASWLVISKFCDSFPSRRVVSLLSVDSFSSSELHANHASRAAAGRVGNYNW